MSVHVCVFVLIYSSLCLPGLPLGMAPPHVAEPVFCKFKPLTNITNIRDFRACSENTEMTYTTDLKMKQNKSSQDNQDLKLFDGHIRHKNDIMLPYTDNNMIENNVSKNDEKLNHFFNPLEDNNTVEKESKNQLLQINEKSTVETRNEDVLIDIERSRERGVRTSTDNEKNVVRSFRSSTELSLNPLNAYYENDADSFITRIYSNMESLTPVPRADVPVPSPVNNLYLSSSHPFSSSHTQHTQHTQHAIPVLHKSLNPSFKKESSNINSKNTSLSLSLSISSSHSIPYSHASSSISRD